jgi:hypothetical protein
MKRLFIMIFCLSMAGFGEVCFAAYHPVEGSDNYLETNDPPEVSDCVDLQFVFARGSGAPQDTSGEWYTFRDLMSDFATRRNYSFVVMDLQYPAVSVRDPITNALGAAVSAGQYYEFGHSV